MSFYERHVFFCVNQREAGEISCANHGSRRVRDYAKQRIKDLGLHGEGKIRVNMAGCLGRCEMGPVMVVYPEGVWYTYVDEEDVDEIIDQHLLKRNRQFDLIEVIEAHPELLGIGIDEDTAIVVQSNSFEVIGQGYVAIYDRDRMIPPAGHFYLLAPGDRYNLSTREASRPTRTMRPIERVTDQKWPK